MRHLSVTQFGSYLGLEGQRLIVRRENQVVGEYPIHRLKSLQIGAKGVGISSNLLYELALRGVNVFFVDYRSIPVLSLSGTHSHAVVELRKHQFEFANNPAFVADLCKRIVIGKIQNQRSVLLYFGKQFKKDKNQDLANSTGNLSHNVIYDSTSKLYEVLKDLKNLDLSQNVNWREQLMGFEGGAAQIYWNCLREAKLLPSSFVNRKGRGAPDITNQALNYGYSVLMSYIWNAVIKAGLEPYLGFYHVIRPGKPSLVLDIMEEYRAWVVDRSVIKIRDLLVKSNSLSEEIKRRIIEEVHQTFGKKHMFFGKKLKVETMLQRQV